MTSGFTDVSKSYEYLAIAVFIDSGNKKLNTINQIVVFRVYSVVNSIVKPPSVYDVIVVYECYGFKK